MNDAPDNWASNTTLPELAEWLRDRSRVVILTHVKPDGDALGASLALARTLRQTGADAVPWFTGPMPTWAPELVGQTPVAYITRTDSPPEDIDALVIVDTGTWSQLDQAREYAESHYDHAAVIDHHLQGDPQIARLRYIDTTAAAVCGPLAGLCTLLLNLKTPASLPPHVAEALYAGIATDTGWFKYPSVTPRTLQLAAALLYTGIDHARLYDILEQRDRPSRLYLLARVLNSLELIKNDTVALMTVTLDDFHAAHAGPEDSSSLSAVPLSVASVRVSCVITEGHSDDPDRPVTKISMRSKHGPGAVDVSEIAARLGGGGHARAAGVRLQCSMDEARRRLLDALP